MKLSSTFVQSKLNSISSNTCRTADELAKLNTTAQEINTTAEAINIELAGVATEATLSDILTNTNFVVVTPHIARVTDDNAAFPATNFRTISFANTGVANALINGVILKPGEILNFDAGALNNIFLAGAFSYNTTTNPGAELLIKWNT